MTKSNKEIIDEMMEYADDVADEMLRDMSPEQAVTMVREFTSTMVDWQPGVAELADDPIKLGISCLSTAKLFVKAFAVAYNYTDKHLQAKEAIEKALKDL